jgi:hypothetical protein
MLGKCSIKQTSDCDLIETDSTVYSILGDYLIPLQLDGVIVLDRCIISHIYERISICLSLDKKGWFRMSPVKNRSWNQEFIDSLKSTMELRMRRYFRAVDDNIKELSVEKTILLMANKDEKNTWSDAYNRAMSAKCIDDKNIWNIVVSEYIVTRIMRVNSKDDVIVLLVEVAMISAIRESMESILGDTLDTKIANILQRTSDLVADSKVVYLHWDGNQYEQDNSITLL